MFSFHPTAKDARAAASGFRTSFNLSSKITNNIWSGIIWEGGKRRADNFLFSDICVLDFDSGEMSLREAVKTFCDTAHWIGTTRSHQKEKGGVISDRFRVAVPWEHRVSDATEYRYNMELLTKKYPVDTQCRDLARLFFPCINIVSVATEGYKFDVAIPPAGWGTPPPVLAPELVGSGVIPGHLVRRMAEPAKPGRIRLAYWQIGRDLRTYGITLADAVAYVLSSKVGALARSADRDAEAREQVTAGWRSNTRSGGK